MSKYFSYCPDAGFEQHDTADEAKKSADESISLFRANAAEGWCEEVDQVCWGEVKEQSTKGEETAVDDMSEEERPFTDCDYICDYTLQPV